MNKSLYHPEIQRIKEALAPFKAFIKRPASEHLSFDYIVPGGPFQAQYDWDSFFMGVALASEISSEAIYLRNCFLNFIINSKTNGKVVGCISPMGYDNRYNHMKPFLAHALYLAGKYLNEYSWLKKYWPRIKKVVLYREKYLWSKKYDLSVWYDGIESGFDNNVAVINYPNSTVIGAELNTYVYREYKSMYLLAKIIDRKKDETDFRKKADNILKHINHFLWHKEDEIFYNMHSETGKIIRRLSFTSLIPLFENLIDKEQGIKTIKKYLLSPDHFWSEFGIRSLSKSDPEYNNKEYLKPISNWQGPVWPLNNYLGMQILLNYGFKDEAIELARKSANLLLNDIKTSRGMHENYDAESGKPLSPDFKVSWNILVANMLSEALEAKNPFLI